MIDSFPKISLIELEYFTENLVPNFLAGSRIAITGANGMLGSYFTELLAKGFSMKNISLEIVGFTRNVNHSSLFRAKGLPKVDLKYSNYVSRRAHSKFDYIFHFASPSNITKVTNLEDLINANSGISKLFLKKGLCGFSFISAGEVYGNTSKKRNEIDQLPNFDLAEPRTWYPISKIHGENFVRSECENLGVQSSIVRLFHTFGPGIRVDDGRSFSDFTWASAFGKPPALKSDGKQVRSFLSLYDSAMGIIYSLNQNRFPILNLGSEEPYSILEFAKLVSKLAGLDEKIVFKLINSNLFSKNDVVLPDCSRMKSLGWRQIHNLESTIIQTLNWIRRGESH